MLKDSVVSELSNLYFLLDAYFSRKSIMIQNNLPVRASSGAGSTDVAENSRLHFFSNQEISLFGPAKSCWTWGFCGFLIIFLDIFGSGLIQILDDGFLWSGRVTI